MNAATIPLLCSSDGRNRIADMYLGSLERTLASGILGVANPLVVQVIFRHSSFLLDFRLISAEPVGTIDRQHAPNHTHAIFGWPLE